MISKNLICQAIEANSILSFYYNGGQRIVAPYLVGLDRSDRVIFVGYQIRGYSESGEFPPWRKFELRKVRNLIQLEGVYDSRKNRIPSDIDLKKKICWRD